MRFQFFAVIMLAMCAFFVLLGPPVFGHPWLAWIRAVAAFGVVLAGVHVAGILRKKLSKG
jgi:hypothetical protein